MMSWTILERQRRRDYSPGYIKSVWQVPPVEQHDLHSLIKDYWMSQIGPTTLPATVLPKILSDAQRVEIVCHDRLITRFPARKVIFHCDSGRLGTGSSTSFRSSAWASMMLPARSRNFAMWRALSVK